MRTVYSPNRYNPSSPFAPARHLNHKGLHKVFDYVVLFCCTIFLLPLRAICLFSTVIAYWLGVRIVTLGKWKQVYDESLLFDPFTGPRRYTLDYLHRGYSRLFLFFYGFILTKRGQPTASNVPAIPNHVAFLDLFALMAYGVRTFVVMREVTTYPFIGFIFRSNCCIFVDRMDKVDCKTAALRLTARLEAAVKEPNNPSILVPSVFPEGSITNQFQVISLKTGVFRSMSPLHPVAISYKGRFNGSNVGVLFISHVYGCLTQIIGKITVDFSHQVVTPASLQVDNPKDYSIACQGILSELLGVPTSSAVCEDIMDWTAVVEGKMCEEEARSRYMERREGCPNLVIVESQDKDMKNEGEEENEDQNNDCLIFSTPFCSPPNTVLGVMESNEVYQLN
ncbi:hypothetical protein RCL1_008834 [Eukaryota sp. TZLM3-RCL]